MHWNCDESVAWIDAVADDVADKWTDSEMVIRNRVVIEVACVMVESIRRLMVQNVDLEDLQQRFFLKKKSSGPSFQISTLENK